MAGKRIKKAPKKARTVKTNSAAVRQRASQVRDSAPTPTYEPQGLSARTKEFAALQARLRELEGDETVQAELRKVKTMEGELAKHREDRDKLQEAIDGLDATIAELESALGLDSPKRAASKGVRAKRLSKEEMASAQAGIVALLKANRKGLGIAAIAEHLGIQTNQARNALKKLDGVEAQGTSKKNTVYVLG